MKPGSTSPIRRDRARRGVTMLEVAIAGAITVVLVGAAMGALHTGQATFSRGSIEASLRAESTRILDALVAELTQCGTSTASLAPADAKGGPYLTAQPCVGDNGSSIVFGDPLTVRCERASAANASSEPSSAAPSAGSNGTPSAGSNGSPSAGSKSGGALATFSRSASMSLGAAAPPPSSLTSPPAPPPEPSLSGESASTAAEDWALVLTKAGVTRILGHALAPNGLQVSLDGSVVTLRLDLERALPGQAPVHVTGIRKLRFAN